MAGKLFMRSQIDAQGYDEDGNNIVFEVKTRATAPLRYEIKNYIDYLDYEIVKFRGHHSSFEREFYDLIRGGLLKYIMQMKIGRMQGAAIAYHNTQQIFGFEYLQLEKMENRIFGCSEFSDIIFSSSLGLLEKILDHILDDKFVDEFSSNKKESDTFRVGFYANEQKRTLDVMVECFESDEIYLERFKDYYQPQYMKDPIDYYLTHKVVPKVVKYTVGIYPVLNGVFIDYAPILFE